MPQAHSTFVFSTFGLLHARIATDMSHVPDKVTQYKTGKASLFAQVGDPCILRCIEQPPAKLDALFKTKRHLTWTLHQLIDGLNRESDVTTVSKAVTEVKPSPSSTRRPRQRRRYASCGRLFKLVFWTDTPYRSCCAWNV